jgi:hypothetical protein
MKEKNNLQRLFEIPFNLELQGVFCQDCELGG